MLRNYRKDQRIVAMGLLSFHSNLKTQLPLLKEIETYETGWPFELYLYYCEDGSSNVQGVIGVEHLSDTEMRLHDISLNPSYRGERIGFAMLSELQALYPDKKILGTAATSSYLAKWQENTR